MKTIWKYTLNPGTNRIEMPDGAVVLSVNEQHGHICIWAEVYTDGALKKTTRVFEIFGTGHQIYEDIGVDRVFLNSVKLDNGALVFHIYERL